jgi:FixJ family two-component response regulator
LQRLPVVIMTGDGDATANNGLQVEAFLTKPLDFQKFIAIVQQLSHFWQADMIVPVRVDSASEGDDFEFDV